MGDDYYNVCLSINSNNTGQKDVHAFQVGYQDLHKAKLSIRDMPPKYALKTMLKDLNKKKQQQQKRINFNLNRLETL